MVARAKPTASATRSIRASILEELRTAYPSGVATHDLISRHGTCAKTRINELDTEEGYSLENYVMADNRDGYRLLSLTPGDPLTIYGGCIIRIDNRGTPTRTHQQSTLPDDVLVEAAAAAEAAFRAVIARSGRAVARPKPAAPKVVERDPLEDLDAFFDSVSYR